MDVTAKPQTQPPDLAVTMAFDPMAGIVGLEEHLAAMRHDADARGYPFDRHAVRNELQAATFRLRGNATVRLLLSPSGAIAIEATPRSR